LAKRGWIEDIRPKQDTTPNDGSLFITPEKKRARDKGVSPSAKRRKSNFNDRIAAAQPEGIGRGMTAKSGSGNPKGLQETEIDEVVNVTRGPPNYTFASLPYIRDITQKITGGTYYMDALCYRMTSVYDPRIGGSVSDLNAGAGVSNVNIVQTDAADVSQQKVRWFNYYAGMYKYYHVVSCRWNITMENLGSTPYWVHVMYTGQTPPPPGATNEDIMCWEGVKSYYVGTHSVALLATGELERTDIGTGEMNEDRDPATVSTALYETGNNIQSRSKGPLLQISGEYKPGDLNQEIRLDSEVENWTAVTTNPTLSERLYIMIKPQADGIDTNSANSSGQYICYRHRATLDYLVEFKELDDKLKWPVVRDPITITLVSDIESTS